MMRIGHGYDSHRFADDGRPLYLCGVPIAGARGLLAHSDGDVSLHALCDALLGAIGAGDIGEHFPATDERWRGAAGADLLSHVMRMVVATGYTVASVDITIVAEQPRLQPYRQAMRARVAALLDVSSAQVNVKATTNEGLDAVGRGEAIVAYAVVLICAAADSA